LRCPWNNPFRGVLVADERRSEKHNKRDMLRKRARKFPQSRAKPAPRGVEFRVND
jgi:hypothetical protein